jgi:hypothetical protein
MQNRLAGANSWHVPAVAARHLDDLGKEQVGHGVGEQTLLVLAEDRSIEDGLFQGQVDEPTEQQIGLQPRAQLPIRTHRVECLQHLCLQ